MKTMPKHSILWSSMFGLGALTGCASSMPQWDAQMGTSVRVLRAAQLLDPQASARNGDKQAALDGKVVLESADRYVNSYKTPPPQNIFVIGQTSTGGGGN